MQYTPVPLSRVKLWRDGPELPPLADEGNDIVVQVGGPVPDADIVRGAGRIDTRLTRLLTVTVRSSCEADDLSTAYLRLLDPNIGHLSLEEYAVDALQMFDPQDGAGNQLLVQPMRLAPSGGPRPVPRSGNWTATAMAFEVVYEAKLVQSRQ